MTVNKVIYDCRTIVDMIDATTTSETVLKGYTAYGANGVPIAGMIWLPGSECDNFKLGA